MIRKRTGGMENRESTVKVQRAFAFEMIDEYLTPAGSARLSGPDIPKQSSAPKFTKTL